MSDKITKAELEQQYHMLQEEYGRLSNEHRELKAKYDGCTHELEGVRGALKREAEMRTKADEELKDWKSRYNVLVRGLEYKSRVQYSSEDKIKELEKDLESMTNSRNWNADEAARLRRWYDNLKKLYDKARKDGEEGCTMWREDAWKARDDRDFYKKKAENLEQAADDYRKKLDEVEKIQRKHNMLTLESLDNALKQWNYVDGKLSHDLCMPLESLIQLLDEYGVNDFCKLRERLMYGPADEYNNALLSIRKLEKRNVDLEGVANDLEKQRRDLEWKLDQERMHRNVQKAMATDFERQLRRKTDDCGDWMDRAFRVEEELRKVKEHDRIAQENFEKAARKNDELQNRINILEQRWTDKFNPEDELFGRKIGEWQEYDAVLIRNGIPSPENLDKKLNPFDFLGKPVKFWRGVSDTLKEYYIDSVEELDNWLHPVWYNNVVCGKIVDTMKKHHVENADDLDCRLTLLEKYQKAAYDLWKSDGFKWLSETVSGRRE